MTCRTRLAAALAVTLSVLIVAGAALLVRAAYFAPMTITADFNTVRALYRGDDVRILGVKVGTVTTVDAHATDVRLTLRIDHGVHIPADAKAVIVAPNLLAARYVQLTPAYSPGNAAMADGAVIPVNHTAVPVEWDEVKTQLMRLATDLGPNSKVSTPAVARFIDSAADALGPNGDKLRQTLAQLSQVSRTVAEGGGNIVDIIKNLQTFVSALSTSAPQIVSLNHRLATLTGVLDDSKSDLDAALTDMSTALGEVQRFIKGSRDQTAESIQRLADVTENLVDHQTDLENTLHLAPNVFANNYLTYDPDTGDKRGGLAFVNFSDPVQFLCGAIGALENVTASETGKLCAQYLGPALRVVNPLNPLFFANMNAMPFPINPYLMKSASPDHILYAEPGLAPGGGGGTPVPPETPPAVSAYTGLGDVPPPAGYGPPGPPPPNHLPAAPSPALYPGAPPIPPGPAALPQLLLPSENPAAQPTPPSGATPSPEGR